MDDDKARSWALVTAGYAFGAAGLLAPRAMATAFGTREVSDELQAVVRSYSVRNLALAAILHRTDEDRARRRLYGVASVMFSTDVVLALLGATRGKTSWRNGFSLGAIAAGLAALAASGASFA